LLLVKNSNDYVHFEQTNAFLPLSHTDGDNTSVTRQIVIPVDIPRVKVVHIAELCILTADDRQPLGAVGQPIAAELKIKHTRSWDDLASEDPAKPDEDNQSLEFSYEVHANPEVWLIGRKRRGNFHERESEVHTFPIMLLPQRHGHLLLPGLEVEVFELQRPSSGGQQDPSAFASTQKQVQSEMGLPQLWGVYSGPPRSQEYDHYLGEEGLGLWSRREERIWPRCEELISPFLLTLSRWTSIYALDVPLQCAAETRGTVDHIVEDKSDGGRHRLRSSLINNVFSKPKQGHGKSILDAANLPRDFEPSPLQPPESEMVNTVAGSAF
jgi:hypothetical protein